MPWRAWHAPAIVLVAMSVGAGCSGSPGEDVPDDPQGSVDSSFALPIEWLADSSRARALPVERPPAVWVLRVAPSRGAALEVPLPEALPSAPEDAPPRAAVEPGLKPPIPRRAGRIAETGLRGPPVHIELDVEIGEDGRVRDVIWAGGAADPARVEAAIECARSMEFFPALRGETPVTVWCRQRFEFGR